MNQTERERLCERCGARYSRGWYTMGDGRTLCDECGDAEMELKDEQSAGCDARTLVA